MKNEMMLHKINGCFYERTEDRRIQNLQFVLIAKSTGETLELPRIGPTGVSLGSQPTCETFTLEPDEVISSLTIDYTDQYVQSVSLVSSKGRLETWGVDTGFTSDKTFRFNDEHELISIYGLVNDIGIITMGVITYDATLCRNVIEPFIDEVRGFVRKGARYISSSAWAGALLMYVLA